MIVSRLGFAAFGIAFLLFSVLLVEQVHAGQANVFIYHRFGESRYPSTNISLKDFRSHLELLKQKQVEVVSLGDLARLLQSDSPLDKHYAVLTIDDGYQSFLTGAMPLLREFGFPATLFVNTDAVGGKGYLDWAQLLELVKEGVEIGHHTASHPHMTDRLPGEGVAEWQARILDDLHRAKDAFKASLGFSPDLFAYPYGEYSPEVQALVRNAGFRAAVAQQSGVVSSDADLFALPRFPMGGPYATASQFRSKLFMRSLPVRQTAPLTTMIGDENPPVLELSIDSDRVDLDRLACYVSGQDQADIEQVDGKDGYYRIVAKKPLTARRSKYTLTAPGKSGGWFWFSQLWIRSDVDEGGY